MRGFGGEQMNRSSYSVVGIAGGLETPNSQAHRLTPMTIKTGDTYAAGQHACELPRARATPAAFSGESAACDARSACRTRMTVVRAAADAATKSRSRIV